MADPKDTHEVVARGGGDDGDDDRIELVDPYAEEEPAAADPPPVQHDEAVQQLKKEKDDLHDRLLRKQAEFENYRKRADKEKREFQQYALFDFVLEVIPILDNFERALSHSEEH